LSAAAAAVSIGARGSEPLSIVQTASSVTTRTPHSWRIWCAVALNAAEVSRILGERSVMRRCVVEAGKRQLRLTETAPRHCAPNEKAR
jgi:hypothetical protein